MKFLKKASLAASIAAVSFGANAELVAMDEMAMAAATGQAGIDIDVTLGATGVNIGEILYTDTVELVDDGTGNLVPDLANGGGGLSVTNLSISAADGGSLTLSNTIDITAQGEVKIGSGAVNGMKLSIGSVDTVTGNYAIGGERASFLDRIAAGADPATATVGSNVIGATELYMNLGEGGALITKVKDPADSRFGDTQIQLQGSMEITSDTTNVSSTSLLSGAVTLDGLKVYGAGGEGTGIDTSANLTFGSYGLEISDLDLTGTIEIASVGLGTGANNNIGSLAISNIQLNDSVVTISGR